MTRILFRRIVCAVDGSDRSGAVLARTLALARVHDAEVTVVHVSDRPRVQPGSVQRTTGDPLSHLRQPGIVADQSRIRWVVTHGNAATEVTRHARALKADLVVLGRSAPRPATGVVGRIAEAVLRVAMCPVLIVPPDARRDPPPFRHILCGASSGLSLATLRHALSLAQEFESRLTILNVDHADRTAVAASRGIDGDIERLRRSIPETADEWCEIEELVAAGDPATELTRAADRVGADLVVVGASVVSARGQGFGSVALGALVLTRAHVLVVPIPGVLHDAAAAARAVHA